MDWVIGLVVLGTIYWIGSEINKSRKSRGQSHLSGFKLVRRGQSDRK